MSKIAQVSQFVSVAVGLLVGFAGCAAKQEPSLRTVGLSEFAGARPASTQPAQPASPRPAIEVAPQSQPSSAVATTATAPASAGAQEVPTIRAGDSIIIDRVVGQVSGRPIFADAILESIDAQLQQESERLSPQDFVPRAYSIIRARLTDIVVDELFLAESEASLTEQQQQGLLALMRQFQERKLSETRGSRSNLEAELQQEGMTPEDMLELEKRRMLIGKLITERIQPRIIVSWKDIQREYERRKADFNPPATVVIQRIRVNNTDEPLVIQQVKDRLQANEDFAAIAESLKLGGAGFEETYRMGTGGITDIPDINEAYRPYLKNLKEGDVTPPIERSGWTVWLRLAKIQQPPPKSLYDVQRQLENELRARRFTEQRMRYERSLLDKGIFTQVDEMNKRVLAVALLRYGK